MGEVRDAEFDLPWTPSVNNYYRHVGPRVLISREGRKYRRMVVSRLGGLFPKFTGKVRLALDCYPPDRRRLRLALDCYPPDRRRRDLDNLLKSLQDALVNAGLLEDDSLVRRLEMEMLDPIEGGLVHVHVAPLPAGGG